MLTNSKTIGIVLPCYNEEAVLLNSFNLLQEKIHSLIELKLISDKSFLCFVDDGSKDKTWDLIQKIANNNTVRGIKLSTNFGHQNALVAGLLTMKSEADCLISLDVDLQDDIDVLDEMIRLYNKGNLIVSGVRDNRDNDTFFKKITAQFFYKLMIFMKVKTIYNHADFRLVDSRVLNEFERFNEVSLFLRGIFPLLGFQTANVYYTRKNREAGETKYPLRKMLSFAWNGITSFSTAPLKLIFSLGIVMFFMSIFIGFWVVFASINGHVIKGWASSLLLNLLFAGINMISLGVIGEYIGKIYQEVKHRPRYIIDKVI